MKNTIIAALTLLASVPMAAHAEEEKNDCTRVPKAQWMSESAIKSSVEKAGYTNLRSIEVKGSCYEIYAFRDGQRTEIHVDPATGMIFSAGESD